jgi:DMSO/TMAO reductase YedYZ molybdopterin-dependent catalytic subunit
MIDDMAFRNMSPNTQKVFAYAVSTGQNRFLRKGADEVAMTRSVPFEKALDDALVVYTQKGEMLRPEQNYPVRLFLPGFEGNMSVSQDPELT